jgi:membrane associated rhomboid family serine protease
MEAVSTRTGRGSIVNDAAYISQVRERLQPLGFSEFPAPADMASRLPITLQRTEPWGRLILAVAAGPEAADSGRRAALAQAAGAWVRNLQHSGQQPCYLILLYPFERRVPDEVAESVRALRQEGPEQRWGLIPWTVDLEVELVDRHTGFPRVEDAVVRALTEVDRGALATAWRQATGPRIGAGPRLRVDLGYVPASRFIMAATIAYYVWTLVIGGGTMSLLGGPSGRTLVAWGANDTAHVIGQGQQWRLFTYMLLHGGLMHIGLNMWAFWSLGRHTEMIYGSGRMSFIYVFAGVAGGIASVAVRPYPVLSVGASGAIMGLLGALLYFSWAIPGRRTDWREFLGPVGATLLFGFFFPGVDNYAHVGGFLGGILAAFLSGIPGQRKVWRLVAMAAAGLLVVLLLAGILPVPRFFG